VITDVRGGRAQLTLLCRVERRPVAPSGRDCARQSNVESGDRRQRRRVHHDTEQRRVVQVTPRRVIQVTVDAVQVYTVSCRASARSDVKRYQKRDQNRDQILETENKLLRPIVRTRPIFWPRDRNLGFQNQVWTKNLGLETWPKYCSHDRD